MSETVTGEVIKITTGEETGKKYVCRFALGEADGLFFVWDKKVPGLNMLVEGAELTITHDGSEYKKVEKIEVPDQAAKETAGRAAPTLATDEAKEAAKKAVEQGESKIEKSIKKLEAGDETAWRIARACALKILMKLPKDNQWSNFSPEANLYECADKLTTYIVTGQKPSKKKQ